MYRWEDRESNLGNTLKTRQYLQCLATGSGGNPEIEATCSMPHNWPCTGGGMESQAWAALWLVRGSDQCPPGHEILPNQSVQLINESASTESKKDQSLPFPLPDLRAIFSANSCRDLIA